MASEFPEPQLARPIRDTGFAFELSDESFARWWSATVLSADATQFVHLLRGSIDEARYVCAMDYITNVEGQDPSADAVVRAYYLAKNQPINLADPQGRVNASYLAASPAVAFLLDRVRLRSRRVAEERIANRTVAKIEELFQRSADLDGAEQLATERAALETSIKFLANQSRERAQETDRRNKQAMQNAITRNREGEGDMTRLPSLAEAKLQLAMLADGHGVEALAAIIRDLSPKELNAD